MSCPIEQDLITLSATSKEFVRQMRRLRRDLIRCKKCPRLSTCCFIKHYNDLVDAAVQELYEEWKSQNS